MKIYFAGSIRAGRDDVPTYQALITHLKRYGDVLTEHVGDYSLSLHGQSHLSDSRIHDRDLDWLRSADVVVAEVSTPSLGVGYEIATAVHRETPVIALYRGERDRLSAMIAGSSGVATVAYTDLPQALRALDTELAELTR
ncbi:nucleoside 2-deoxyribosyltransferase [Sphaerisporangium sp. NPDC004334]